MTSRLACAGLGLLALLAGAASASDVAPSPPPAARTHLVPGELARVDLARRSLVVKTAGTEAAPAGELEAWTDPDTRLVARGRVVRLEDLRPGDRVLVSCADVSGRHQARVVKVVSPVAVPSPPPAADPAPAPSPGAGGAVTGRVPFERTSF